MAHAGEQFTTEIVENPKIKKWVPWMVSAMAVGIILILLSVFTSKFFQPKPIGRGEGFVVLPPQSEVGLIVGPTGKCEEGCWTKYFTRPANARTFVVLNYGTLDVQYATLDGDKIKFEDPFLDFDPLQVKYFQRGVVVRGVRFRNKGTEEVKVKIVLR